MAVIFLTYVNIGNYWTYIELAARKAAVADELISQLLVWGSLFSVLGCLLAMATAVGILSQGIDTPKLIISILSFNLLWIFVDVYQMAFAANADHSGSFASLIPCALKVWD